MLVVVSRRKEDTYDLRYLTYSILKDFLTCPEKGRLSHIKRLKKPGVKSVLLFGTGLHYAIENYYRKNLEPESVFSQYWNDAVKKEEKIEFREGEDEANLHEAGKDLLRKWKDARETPRDFNLLEENQKIEIYGVPFYATIDFVGENGKLLIDWKTSSFKYNALKAEYDLQLTVYSYILSQVYEKTPERVGFGVFVKKKDSEVQYVWGRQRNGEDFRNFEKMVLKVWRDIERGEFFRNPGLHCQWCDFLPLCIGEVGEEAYEVKDGKYYQRYEIDVE